MEAGIQLHYSTQWDDYFLQSAEAVEKIRARKTLRSLVMKS